MLRGAVTLIDAFGEEYAPAILKGTQTKVSGINSVNSFCEVVSLNSICTILICCYRSAHTLNRLTFKWARLLPTADGKGELNFPLLSDAEHKIIDAYGLHDPAYDGQEPGIPHPAVYVIDRTGKIAWAKIESNYRERPANQEIRGALDALK